MRILFCLAALVAVTFAQDTNHTPPKVMVYSHGPAEFGTVNTLICHVSGFHPPDIMIQLMKDDEEIRNAEQTDLAFKKNWRFHLTKSVPFTPKEGEKYSCKVTHGSTPKQYAWDPNM
ncbi:beta-2-microglobulin-like [Pseudochaenichthys georgianus]|uniref:beta-2-microglobulin-like n=1 Tax=Pseudochaenichthys georgianus TaxID=52239 RepID=UPI00146B1DE0|nr:beta-2-microglobulin-like [Pseudochaenichthys georgianus]